jgi:AcrR family transcriptional regulator
MEEKKYHHGDLKNALIKVGIEILSTDGVGGLSLRKVAKLAGVSHAAPYAHFTDKQALIAAISTEGHRNLYYRLSQTIETYQDNPHKQLIETAWGYIQFAQEEKDCFQIMFSDVLEQEKDYPEFVEVSKETFQLVVDVVENCIDAGILKKEPVQLLAAVVWGQMHGLISLIQSGQISHNVLDEYPLRKLMIRALNQITLIPYRE